MEKTETTVYELGYHVVPTIAAGDLAGEVTTIKDVLTNHGAVQISEEFPRTIKLAYRIEKQISGKLEKFNSAYFGWIKFETTAAQAVALKAQLDTHKSILRSLLVKTVKENTYLGPKFTQRKGGKSEDGEEPTEKTEPAKEVNAEELDKSIEKLVAAE